LTPLLLALVAVVGLLVGLAGVGGVLLPPALVAIGGMTPQAATATSTWVFLFTGVVGSVAFSWRGLVPWPMFVRLAVGIAPAAFAGARTNAVLPPSAVLFALAALTLFVGLHQLLPSTGQGRVRDLSTPSLVALGAVVGFGSALTGTGGPVLLVPILLAFGVTVLRAVAVSQVAQLPVVASASLGYLDAGVTDVRLGTLLGVIAAAGTVLGSAVAARVRAPRLRQVVSLVCVASGLFLLVRTAATLT
jgi:uncharacterized protein